VVRRTPLGPKIQLAAPTRPADPLSLLALLIVRLRSVMLGCKLDFILMTVVFPRAWTASTAIRRAVSPVVYGVIVALAAFHAWLLAAQLAGGQLFEPAVAVRWLAGALILSGFAALRRLGVPLLRGRKAIVLWLFVVLLHLNVIASPTDFAASMSAAIPEAVTGLAAPAALAPFFAAVGLLFLARASRAHAGGLRVSGFCPARPALRGGPRSGYIPQSSTRPPPR